MLQKWVLEVKEGLKNMVDLPAETEHWKKRSIYQIPTCLTDLNKKAFKPQIVSFGPYHHGQHQVKPMEEHKHRALLHFLKRCGKPIEMFLSSLAEVVQNLKDSYDPLGPEWKDDTCRFLQLMILDGCFMLEVLRTCYTHRSDDYSPNDPIFSIHGKLYIMPYFKRDMLMLENQLPMLVLHKLLAVESDHVNYQVHVDFFFILKFFWVFFN